MSNLKLIALLLVIFGITVAVSPFISEEIPKCPKGTHLKAIDLGSAESKSGITGYQMRYQCEKDKKEPNK